MPFCNQCGKEISREARFCQSCGKAIRPTQTNSEKRNGRSHSGPSRGEAAPGFGLNLQKPNATATTRQRFGAFLPWIIILTVVVAGFHLNSTKKVIDIARSKVLHVHDTDYKLRELVVIWNPQQNRLMTGGDMQQFLVREDPSKWKARRVDRSRYLVTATWQSNTYQFNVDPRSGEVSPANDLAKRLFALPNASWKATSPFQFQHQVRGGPGGVASAPSQKDDEYPDGPSDDYVPEKEQGEASNPINSNDLHPEDVTNLNSLDRKIITYLDDEYTRAIPTRKLIFDDVDSSAEKHWKFDRRVTKLLVHLAGDLGHRLAVRVMSGYETDATAFSRESHYSRGESPNISAHNTGQAVDIVIADGVPMCWQSSKDPMRKHMAQQILRQILREVFDFQKKDQEVHPQQILVFNQEDVDFFRDDRRRLYGPDLSFGLAGMGAKPEMENWIHIGF